MTQAQTYTATGLIQMIELPSNAEITYSVQSPDDFEHSVRTQEEINSTETLVLTPASLSVSNTIHTTDSKWFLLFRAKENIPVTVHVESKAHSSWSSRWMMPFGVVLIAIIVYYMYTNKKTEKSTPKVDATSLLEKLRSTVNN